MKRNKKIASIFALVLLCVALCVFAACDKQDDPPPTDPTPPVKVSDGIDFELGVGAEKNITVADYITANGNAVTASSDTTNATAEVKSGLLTVTGAAEGEAEVTLKCGEVTVTFGVTVFMRYEVTVDGKITYVRKGETFTLPEPPAIEDENMTFDHWSVGDEQKAPGDVIDVTESITVTSVLKRKAAVKVKDGEPVEAALGSDKVLKVSEYIIAYGATVTAESDSETIATAKVEDGKIIITPIAEGGAKVTVVCGQISIEFDVTVTAAPVMYTVTVDGVKAADVAAGETFTLPAAIASPDPDFEFAGWNVGAEVKQPGEQITIEEDTAITVKFARKAAEKIKDGGEVYISVGGTTVAEYAVSDYIATHGNTVTASSENEEIATAALDAGKLVVTAIAAGDTTVSLECGEVTVTFDVFVTSTADGAPVFENGTIEFDLFESSSGTYEFAITAEQGSNFTYEYTVTPDTGVTVSGNSLTYTASSAGSVTLTVRVTATDAVLGTKTTSFTVTVNVTDTTPVVKDGEVVDTTVKDMYLGAPVIDLAANIENAANVQKYKVNGVEVAGTEYTLPQGEYGETTSEVTLTVEAVISDTKSVTYTYKLSVIDSSAFRMTNGSFDDGLDGWNKYGEIGNVSSATAYWTGENGGVGYSFNADGKFFSAYEPVDKYESNIGALVSSTFKVSTNRIITFKLGGAKHDVFVDVVDAQNGEILARYGNSAWAEITNGLKSGCTLIAYKAVLPERAAGKTVYIRVIDMAQSDFGLLFCDSFETFYADAPEGEFVDAVDVADRPATVYDIYNGGFELGMSGWSVSGGDIGAVTSDSKYWHGGDPATRGTEYGKEGDKLFSWWSWEGNPESDEENPGHEVNREGNMGTLTSNMFVLKSGKTVSFMIGGGGNRNVFVELVNAQSGKVVAIFRNDNIQDAVLKTYHYVNTLDADALCYFRVVDVAVTGWACFAVDGFKVNLDEAPAGSVEATDHIGEYRSVVNGSFESGNLDGWQMFSEGELGRVVENEISESWYQTNESVKDGSCLFTFYPEKDVNLEGSTGIIRSSTFVLESNGIVSFRFGAAHNREVYINLYTASGKLLAQFRNNAYTKDTEMVHYYYQADNADELTCYFEVVDNATGDYGCIVMDDFRVNLDAVPEGAVLGSALTKGEREENA